MASRSRRVDNGQKSKSETPSASVTENESNDNDSDEEVVEQVKKQRSRKSNGGDMSLNKSVLQMPDDMRKLIERVLCCSCGKQINVMNPGALRKHPWLKVATCKKCYKYLKSGPFSRDSDGIDEQCRWCGDGGRLYGCDYCNHCFCQVCIKRNLGRSEAALMEEDTGSKWRCYLCKPKKIQKLVDDCQKILDFIDKEEKKEQERLERQKQREREQDKKLLVKKEKQPDKLVVKTEEESVKEVKIEKDDSSLPKQSRRSLPAPRDKEKIEALKVDAAKVVKVEPNTTKSDPDVVIIDGSPDTKVINKIPHFQHHRATLYKPDSNTGVQKVVKEANVLAVTVGPKKPVVVTTPYRDKAFVPMIVNTSSNKLIGQPGVAQPSFGLLNHVQMQNVNLQSLLSKPITAINGPSFGTNMAVQQTLKNKIKPPPNNIDHFKQSLTAGNVEFVSEKLSIFVQSLGLCIDAAKTDLSIAKLTHTNLLQAKSRAVVTIELGFEKFFDSLRDMLHVQFLTNVAETPVQSAKTAPSVSQKKDNADIITIIEEDNGAIKEISNIHKGSDKNLIELSDSESSSMIVTNVEKNGIGEEDPEKDKMEIDSVRENENVDNVETNSGKVETENSEEPKTGGVKNCENGDDSKIDESIAEDDENESSDEPIGTDVADVDKKDESDINQETDSLEKYQPENKEKAKTGENDLDDSENTAAELELLKEIADEMHEESEVDEEETRTRRTTRKKGDTQSVPSTEEPSNSKKSRNLKKTREEKNSASDSESDEADSKTTKKSSERNKDNSKAEKDNKTKESNKALKQDKTVSNSDTDREKSVEQKENDAHDDVDDEDNNGDESSSTFRRSTRNRNESKLEKKHRKSDLSCIDKSETTISNTKELKKNKTVTNSDTDLEKSTAHNDNDEVEDDYDEESSSTFRRSARNRNESKLEKKPSKSDLSCSEKSEIHQSSKTVKLRSKDKLTDDEESENSAPTKESVSKPDNKSSSKNGKGKMTTKHDDSDVNDNSNDEDIESNNSGKKKEQEKKSSKENKKPSEKTDKRKLLDSDSDTMESKSEEEFVTNKSSKKGGQEKKSSKENKKTLKKSDKKKVQDSDSDTMESKNDEEIVSNKSSKKGEQEKKLSKESIKTEKTDKKNVLDSDSDTMDGPVDLPDIIANGEDSNSDDDSDDDDSGDELPKKRTKQKVKESSRDSSSRKTRQRAAKNEAEKKLKSKPKEKEPAESDSDPNYDADLEKEIASFSKETRLTRKKKQESKREEKKLKKSDKSSKKKGLDLVSDSDTDEDFVSKPKKKKVMSDEDDEENEAEDDDEEDMDSDKSEELTASQIKKLAKAKKASEEEESDFEDEMPSDMSSDPEVSFPKLSTPKKGDKSEGKSKGKKSKFEDDISDDSDFVTPKKKKRFNSKILDAKISDSDSEEEAKGKKGAKKGKSKGKRKAEDSSDDDTDTGNRKSKDKKRRRIKRMNSSDEEKEPGAEDDIGTDDEDVPDPDTPGGYLKRRKIRKVQGQKKLADETKAAQKAEEARRKRIEERQKEYNAYVEVEGAEEEGDIPEGTEREQVIDTSSTNDAIAKILGSPRKVPVTTKCVLEMDENKKPLIEVDRTLIRKLKPHQVEAVRFMYNCCVESVARLKKEEGAGCILAHCMGLGKTLSVITFVHTMLSNVKLTKMSKCLVVCPLNTCLNWVNEFQIWLDDVDFEIEVYEMSRVKQNFERAQMLKEWHEGGAGVMILGYDMYRNLVKGSHCKNKKQKKIFVETLSNPGPDLVVCDEGHILKNDQTSLSKAMNTVTSRRRIVLTGTPLQNNLGEYHCMLSFVKPSLLGTRKEFYNRFANPITNGQCSDSTPTDVKVMKRRAHILHELLAGCVQRKDYSALTKFLPPKMEYVISVRLSKVQMSLYEKYLELSGVTTTPDTKTKGAQLFKDYQALMRIWTHPWVLKLDEIRQENKRQYDDSEDSFIEDEDSEAEEDSFIDDSTTSDEDDDNAMSDDSTKKAKNKKGKKSKKGSSSSDEDGKTENNEDEVVKKWTSRRRGNEEGAGSSWMDDADMGYGGPRELTSEWWAEFVKEDDEYKLELSGKLMLLFEILKMCEDIGDKVLVFSQSLLSLDIIEDFLAKIDEANQPEASGDGDNAGNKDGKAGDKPVEVVAGGSGGASSSEIGAGEGASKELSEADKKAKELKERLSQYGKSWTKGGDYFRMDGSTSSIHRKQAQDMFNDPENFRARLFLISTKAGSLGINLVSANRVIIFDASWNPSHDIQSIFRVYRFGQVKPVYVYRFLAQGTMEEKIYERQVTKQSLSQRVVDEHQIERHFTAADLQELYRFTPDRLDDPNRKERPLPILPKDHMLAEISTTNKEWIVTFHEHDSLLENVEEQKLTEDEKKAAWEDYENEKKGINMNMQKMMGGAMMGGMMPGQMGSIQQQMLATQQLNMQNLLLQGSANLGQAAVLQIVQDLKARFPTLSPDLFQQRVQAVLRQVLTQQIMQQSEMQRRQIEQQRLNELNRLNQIKQQIQRQQAMLGNQQHSWNSARMPGPTGSYITNLGQAPGGATGQNQSLHLSGSMPNLQRQLMGLGGQQGANSNTQKK